MRYFILACLFVLTALLMMCSFINNPNRWVVKSPDGQIVVTLELAQDEQGESTLSSQGRLQYQVSCGSQTVIKASPLGLDCEDDSFSENLIFLAKSRQKINEKYTLHNGKKSDLTNNASQLTLTFMNEKNARCEVIVRAYNDGVGLKYALPGEGEKVITGEVTGFKIPAGTAFIMPYDNPGQWWPAYENYYGQYEVGSSSPTEAGWAFPALFRINEGQNYVLLSESGLNGSYCGTRLHQDAPDGLYKVRFPEEADGEGVGAVTPVVSLPWESSWKVIIVGDEPGDIVESNLVTHLADPPAFPVGDYIKPGRAAWSWWSDSDSPRNFAKQKTFIDLAVEMGWEYYLLDANWNYEPMEDLLDFVNYANEKGIGVLVWYNSGGPHNIVTEAPRDRLYEKERRRQEFAWLQEIGVKGVKVDFWHSDKQAAIQYYIDLMKDANDYNILVNFHGCTIPRGWERTYPNMLTLESMRGAESYKFAPEYPEKAVWHNVNLVFTRNVIGPMDYTPVTFTNMEYPHLTTVGHELALSVVFQSGIQHFADQPAGYLTLPDAAKQFLKDVPTTWDEIKFIAGQPGEFVVLARRKGDSWTIAGISGLKEEKNVTIDLSQFAANEALLIGDATKDSFDIRTLSVGAQDIKMLPYGGFVIRCE
ncbi:glycoside hydrolase family 97 protein [candidate division KSB1 bacterium]|nr:glycoside hydrolase family 97 catalytic domain-containing protein [candidate division KSB1 bacterium]RQW06907.1 MAG: glycoside hydrolase family 97 protein [candidate division KSB1 bacterium]